jgi:pimeloyl-ACP methyl ester carboxylesterase
VRALGRDRATLVGHDWGGVIAFTAAHAEPDVVERLVVLNAPHPGTMLGELVRNPRQLRRSLYILFFQLPLLPERALTRNGAALVARTLRGGSHVREAWPRDELDRYRAAFLEAGAASAALAYYRTAARRALLGRRAVRANPIACPTLVLWGVHDRALGDELVAPRRLAPFFASGNAPEIVRIAEAGHFVQNEAPERVNAELLRWLSLRRTTAQARRPAP